MRVPILPPPGINMDDTAYAATGQWADGSNVRFSYGFAETIGPNANLQSGALETYTQVKKLLAYKVGASVRIAVATLDEVFTVNTADWTRTQIDPLAYVGFTRASLAMFGDVLLMSGTGGTIYESSSGGAATEITNAPDAITTMLVTPSRQVMALGCNEEVSGTFNGRAIRWSDIEDRTDWTTLSTNNAGEYILPGQENIVGACNFGDHILLWTEGSMFLGSYRGDPGQTFVFQRIAKTGLAAHDAWAVYKETVYWLAGDLTPHAYTLGALPVAIPCQLLTEDLLDGIARSNMVRVNAVAIARFGEVWWWYNTTGTGTANRYIAYCVEESRRAQRPVWFRGVMNCDAALDSPLLRDVTAGGNGFGGSTLLRASGTPSSPLESFDRTTSGSGPTWHIQSADRYIDEDRRRFMVKRFIPDFQRIDEDVTLNLFFRDRPEDGNIVTKGPYTIADSPMSERVDFRASGRIVAVKFNGTAPMRLGKCAFDVVAMGER